MSLEQWRKPRKVSQVWHNNNTYTFTFALAWSIPHIFSWNAVCFQNHVSSRYDEWMTIFVVFFQKKPLRVREGVNVFLPLHPRHQTPTRQAPLRLLLHQIPLTRKQVKSFPSFVITTTTTTTTTFLWHTCHSRGRLYLNGSSSVSVHKWWCWLWWW